MNKAGTVAALTGLLVLSGCVQPAIRDLPGPDLPETAANSPQAGLKKRPLSDEQLFIGCAGCHSLAADAAHKTGPNLYGISGQAAAKQPGFSYSKALQEAAESWLQWDEETLSIFIQQNRTNGAGYLDALLQYTGRSRDPQAGRLYS